MKQTGVREFIAVVENGSFTSAANTLDVSTSFVSRQVTKLEDRLGTRLLHRTTRSVRLTDLGRTYYERSRDIFDQLDALESDMADLQEQPRGRVRITAAGFYAERYVAPAVAEFTARYPEVSIELNTSMRLTDIVAEGFDLAIRMNAPTDSSLVARKVVSQRLMVCASPEYLSKHGTPRVPEDLRKHNCLMLGDMPWRFATSDSVNTVKVRGSWTSDNGRALVAAAVRGVGLVRITDYYMRNELALGQLEPVLEKFEVQDAATWIMYPDRHHLPTRVRYLIDFLVARLREMKQQDGG